MIHRTTNPGHTEYFRYGGRGIQVCDKWHSFDSFYQDMKDGYLPGLSIDRIDNSQGYSPENCRWATKRDQANNRRSNVVLEFAGRKQTMQQWCDELGLKIGTVWARLNRGWSVDRALTEEVRHA